MAQHRDKKARSESPLQPEYLQGWVTDDVGDWMGAEPMSKYLFRGKPMQRAPNREYYYPGHDTTTYRWGQQRVMYPGGPEYTGTQMPPWMVAMADTISARWGQRVNHAILTKYEHGTRTHSPAHKDKIPADTGFFLLSFGTPRRFQFLETEMREVTKKGTTRLKEVPGAVVWEQELASGSLLVVTPQMNREFFHALPKTRAWQGQPRFSLIFRTIR